MPEKKIGDTIELSREKWIIKKILKDEIEIEDIYGSRDTINRKDFKNRIKFSKK